MTDIGLGAGRMKTYLSIPTMGGMPAICCQDVCIRRLRAFDLHPDKRKKHCAISSRGSGTRGSGFVAVLATVSLPPPQASRDRSAVADRAFCSAAASLQI